MISAFYASKSGAKNYQFYLDAIANNVANVNTHGYKAQNVNFTDLLYAEEYGLQIGTGSKAVVTRDMSAGGVLSSTALSVMVEGDGFIAVQGADGQTAYTRSANLGVAEIGGVNYLITSSGDFVLDENLNRIVIGDTQNPIILKAPAEAGDAAGTYTLGVFAFINSEDLIALGDGKYAVNAENGMTAIPDIASKLLQNMEEASNVDLVNEMTKMITAQRGFQLNAQMIKTADEMEQTAINLNV